MSDPNACACRRIDYRAEVDDKDAACGWECLACGRRFDPANVVNHMMATLADTRLERDSLVRVMAGCVERWRREPAWNMGATLDDYLRDRSRRTR